MLPTTAELRPYLIDFGHAIQRRRQILEVGKTSGAVGTLPFMSIHVHNGTRKLLTPACCAFGSTWIFFVACDRRDDLVSLAYTLIYLACGTLPWVHCKDVKECVKQKRSFQPSQFQPSLPSALALFFDYAQNLECVSCFSVFVVFLFLTPD